jgi:hypothetical protein
MEQKPTAFADFLSGAEMWFGRSAQQERIEVGIEDMEIHAGGITRPHRVIASISARVGAATLLG